MPQRETRTYTDDQILDTLMFGLAQVEIIDPPDELRAEVFRQACSLHSMKRIEILQSPLAAARIIGGQ